MSEHRSARLAWIDLAKGIGMILVVVGHACAEGTSVGAHWARSAIYLFHMPLFFIVSGYLARPASFAEYTRQRLNALILPYICYLFLIGVPLALMTHQLHGRSAGLEFALYLYGGRHLVTYMTVFWFVTCLFFAQLVFQGVLRAGNSPYDWRVVGLVGACGIYSYAFMPQHNFMAPFDVDVVPMALVFLWFGQIYKRLEDRSLILIGLCLIALLGLGVYLQHMPLYTFDMKSGIFGPFWPGLSTAVALSWLLFEFCKWLTPCKILVTWISPLGRASLSIMFLAEPIRRLLLMAGAPAVLSIAAALSLPVALHLAFKQNRWLSRLFLGQPAQAATSVSTNTL